MSHSHPASRTDFLFLASAILFLALAVLELGGRLRHVEDQVLIGAPVPPEPFGPAPAAAAQDKPEGMTPIRIVPAVKRTRASTPPAPAVKRTRPKAV